MEAVVALYRLDEGSGRIAHDVSGNGNHGEIHGAEWTDEGLRFDGMDDHIKVPHSPSLNLMDRFTIEAWVKGKGAEFSLEEKTSGRPPKRAPHFQVVGDKIYFATNADIPDPGGTKWVDWNIWTGEMNFDGTGWREVQRTFSPPFCIEPKLQVVGDEIYYEYFGVQDVYAELDEKYGQIFTARSNVDGTGWRTIPRIDYPPGSKGKNVEQGNMQVVGDRIYYAYPQMDEGHRWQSWTAESKVDGTGWKAVQRTEDGGWIPRLQAAGGFVYYLYSRIPEKDLFRFARVRMDGTDWKVIRTIEVRHLYPWPFFYIFKDRIYFTYSALDERGISQLWTGWMNIDGTDLNVTQRTFGRYDTPPAGIQIVGDKIYYAYTQAEVEGPRDPRKPWEKRYQLWTARSNIDGTGWKAVKRTEGEIRHDWGYRAFQVVGGKVYYCANVVYSFITDWRISFGSSGSNIVNKGDAYGIGVTEEGEARAFVNAGQDYLFRAEAPEDTAGAIADHPMDDRWHYLVMTYDGTEVRLYIDGELKSSTPYTSPAAINPFDLIVGDGFRGIIAELGIYRRVKTPEEIKERYRASMRKA